MMVKYWMFIVSITSTVRSPYWLTALAQGWTCCRGGGKAQGCWTGKYNAFLPIGMGMSLGFRRLFYQQYEFGRVKMGYTQKRVILNDFNRTYYDYIIHEALGTGYLNFGDTQRDFGREHDLGFGDFGWSAGWRKTKWPTHLSQVSDSLPSGSLT